MALVALALLAVYLTAVLSWMGWHGTMERYPYVYRNDDGSLNLSEQFRVFSDLAVAILYAYVLFKIDPLKTVPSSDSDHQRNYHQRGHPQQPHAMPPQVFDHALQ